MLSISGDNPCRDGIIKKEYNISVVDTQNDPPMFVSFLKQNWKWLLDFWISLHYPIWQPSNGPSALQW